MLLSKRLALIAALAALIPASAAQARAAEPRLVSTHGDWSVFVHEANGAKICYMASEPKSHEGKYDKRGEIFAIIAHRPTDGVRDEFSYVAGYPYKKESSVELSIDSQNFKLFTHDETAWAVEGDDAKIARALRGGSKMVVKGTSARGTDTVDGFSLKGSSAAHAAISRECPAK